MINKRAHENLEIEEKAPSESPGRTKPSQRGGLKKRDLR